MELYKKLLFVGGLCLANFYAFADAEENEITKTVVSESNYSKNSDTEESVSWLSNYPIYAQVRIGFGTGSKFSYLVDNSEGINKADYEKRVFHQQVGLEIGKIIDEWRFGVELGYFHGSVKEFKNKNNDTETSCSMHGLMLLANAYYNIPLTKEKEWFLVLGAGLGGEVIKCCLKSNDNELSDQLKDGTCFAALCQGYIGLAYDINEDATINLGYRLLKPINNIKWTSYEENNEKTTSGWENAWIHTFECSFMWRFE